MVTEHIPNLGIGNITDALVYIFLTVIMLIVFGIGGFLLYRYMKFNKKVIIFEKINNKFEPAKRDKAMLMKYGTGGDQLFYLRKLKKYLPVPEIQTGRNIYWFFLREDGELINFGPGDFDEQSRSLGAKFLDKEMRYARVSLQSHWKERYEKPKFWEKYAGVIMNIIAITLILVFLFLVVQEYVGALGTLEGLLKTSSDVQEANLRVLAALDNVCQGSGLVPQ